ncbi:hypothetical protein BaRGS_00033180 [Batillaria attramentaria]|uniref:Uncharacterized protein n=1 Tax=Batillaria attramentaria TaxID=370345 RepID=A0ABD0J0U0_9CAEN
MRRYHGGRPLVGGDSKLGIASGHDADDYAPTMSRVRQKVSGVAGENLQQVFARIGPPNLWLRFRRNKSRCECAEGDLSCS